MAQILKNIPHGSNNNWDDKIIQINKQKSNVKGHPIMNLEEKVAFSSTQVWNNSPAFLSFRIKDL